MKATARRTTNGTYRHSVTIRTHELAIDEPREQGGEDTGPSPQELLAASLASCTAATMEIYAKRKGWDIGNVEVTAEYTPAERGCPTSFKLELRVPDGLSDEQLERLQVIATKCPVHRTLEGEVMFEDRLTVIGATAEAAVPATPAKRELRLRRRPLSRT